MDKKILFVIPDGVGIRNYLYSDVFHHLKQQGFKIHLMHHLEPQVLNYVKNERGIDFSDEPVRKVSESRFQQFLRETSTYARLKHNSKLKQNPTILTNWFKVKNNPLKRVFQKATELASATLSSYDGIKYLEETNRFKWRRSLAYKEFRSDIRRIQPDLIFITHQRVATLEPLCLAAADLGVKTVTAIFSWDNLPKARLPIRTDHYAVWSEYMKNELLEYYPEIPEPSIAVVGTPQFDFHFQPELLESREEFAARYGLDSSKKWILFSGDDELTSPHDPEYLKDVASALASDPQVSILFRQVPVCTVDRYQAVLDQYPNIIHVPPKWEKGTSWMSFYPLFEDVKLLMNLCHHCECSVNIGSTIGLDFSYFGKPTVFLAYDTVQDQHWSTDVVYQFQHFRSFEGLDAVVFAKEKSSLATLLKQVLENPSRFSTQKHLWRDKIAANTENAPSSVQIAAFLESLLIEKEAVQE
ncbi:glycosyltransferase family protein [Algoriphagus halophilus]|uniref:CDP-Glycerol:Poly(Glycerophosphate) glycerophosphotransferase n=1 Tax=Algoriphagus halophilus TaxID=226505 RepID=A0A1N6EEB9_9BACT|nr:hypothetical protein [Algoriphagus halophilus]SIN81301.1 hypothetical protein SAMN05444394_2039 [Algoriphagus halophilus]